MQRLLTCLVLLVVVTGCAQQPAGPPGNQSALLFDAQTVAQSEKVAIFIPGALASVNIFGGAQTWGERGYAPVYYRFPGLDGLALDRQLDISSAADTIAAFANQNPGKSYALVGFSTGGPIALEAAAKIRSDHPVAVAAISPAVERAGGVPTALRGFRDVTAAAARSKSLNLAVVWPTYWQTLLFGPKGRSDPTKQPTIDRLTEEQKSSIVIPNAAIARSHTRDLRRWTIPDDFDLNNTRVGFFIGLSDPVFSTRQTLRFANALGTGIIYGYPGQGHLLFFTRPDVFEDMYNFVENTQ